MCITSNKLICSLKMPKQTICTRGKVFDYFFILLLFWSWCLDHLADEVVVLFNPLTAFRPKKKRDKIKDLHWNGTCGKCFITGRLDAESSLKHILYNKHYLRTTKTKAISLSLSLFLWSAMCPAHLLGIIYMSHINNVANWKSIPIESRERARGRKMQKKLKFKHVFSAFTLSTICNFANH